MVLIIIANVMFNYLAGTPVRVSLRLVLNINVLVLKVILIINKWKKMSIGIDFGIGIDQNSWYRTGIVSKPKKLISPITRESRVVCCLF